MKHSSQLPRQRPGVSLRVRLGRDERVNTAQHPRSRSFARRLARHTANPTNDLWQPLVELPACPSGSLGPALTYIDEHLGEDLALASIAAEVALSPFHFARLFKQATGLSPHQYVVRRRVERARELIESRQGTVACVAVTVGFCDQSHLARHFKRLLGIAPAQLLAEHKDSSKAAGEVHGWQHLAA